MRKSSILIVDDEKGFTDMLMLSLNSKPDFSANVENNSENAAERVSQIRPDLVILDLIMPGVDGLEVFRRMRASVGCENIPVIFLSASDNAEMRSICQREGLKTTYLIKPTPLETLLNTVKRMI